MKRITRPTVVLACLVVVSLLSGACASAPAPAPPAPPSASASPKQASPPASSSAPAAKPSTPPAPATVRVGIVGSSSDAAIFIAEEKGYFKKQGITNQIERFDSGGKMTPPLATNQLDVGAGSPTAGLYNAVARDISIKIVADKGSDLKGFGYQGLAVRADLADKIKEYKDLKGMKVGMGAASGGSAEIVLAHALRKGGLTEKDVEIINLAPADFNVALRNKSIDAVVTWEPMRTQGIKLGVAVDWKRADEVYPDHQSATIFYSGEFARTKTDVGNRWMVAYVKGSRYYNDAFRKGVNKADVIQILVKATGAQAAVLEESVPVGLNPDGYVNFKGLSDDLETLRQLGFIKEQVDIKQVVDNQFADYAVKQLGPYKY